MRKSAVYPAAAFAATLLLLGAAAQVKVVLEGRPLSGEGHRQIGFYLWLAGAVDNVKVFTRRDVVRPATTATDATGGAPANPNLLGNGSFEVLNTRYTRVPNEWNIRPFARADRAELVDDRDGAHSGNRYMRLYSPSGPGIRLDALPAGQGLRLTLGEAYDITLWARAEPGAEGATLLVEPGRHRAALTGEWKKYTFAYVHPAKAHALLGLYVSVNGGPIAVDDVAMAPKGQEPVWVVPPSQPKGTPRKPPGTPIVKRPVMGWRPTVEKVLPTHVMPGPGGARIAAARNEQESFQIVMDTDRDLPGVTLTVTDLVGPGGRARIPADEVKFHLADTVYCPLAGSPGLYPDPLVPWRRRDVAGRRIALATVHVPGDAPAGEYRATITAACADGTKMEMPLVLEVLDFALPDELAFELVFWADNFGGDVKKGGVVPPQRRKFYSRHNPSGSVLALAKILAEHHGSPFYSHHDKTPYAVPWHWNPKTESATFDFTWLDRNGGILLEQYGVAYLGFGGKFRPNGRGSGRAWDWHRDVEKARTQGGGEMAWPGHRYPLDSEEGKKMYRAYCEGIAKHLKEKGWLDRSYMYVCDETEPGKPSDMVKWCAQTAHKAGLRTFAASSAWSWPVYLSEIDAFTGFVSPRSLERVKKEGNEWWGVYNRPCGVTQPLANARLIGADSFFRGTSHYCTYFAYVPDNWIDARDMSNVGPNAGYAYGDFVQGMGRDHSWASWVYPFPVWELEDPNAPVPLYASSLRLEALREGVEDYEYLKLLEQIEKAQKGDASLKRTAQELLERMRSLIEKGAPHRRHGGQDEFFFVIDGEKYYELRCEIGREISRHFSERERRRP